MTEGREAEERLQAALAGRFAIEREIGRGGMAVVYLAQDLRNSRSVALKVLSGEAAVGDAPLRFLREIYVTAGLVHPHILPLLDSDTVEGIHYYVMPYVDGESLRDRLAREGRLPVEDTVQIATEVAEALAHAHKQGLVHRDIKPGNVLLGADHVFLADFGIVRSSDPTTPDLTQQGRFLGTPHYQSPEQWKGEETLDGRSDLYSLGCVVFEMLSGEPPFRGASPQAVAGKHLFEKPPPISLFRPSVPTAVDRVVAKAMAKDPADRYRTVSAFVDALRAATGKGQWSEGLGRWKRVAAVVGGLVAVALLARFLPEVLGSGSDPGVVPDTTRYAIFAQEVPNQGANELEMVPRLSAALERWEGLSVAEPLRTEDLEDPTEDGRIPPAALARLARGLGVGRVVRVSVTPVGEGWRLSAELLDATRAGHRLTSQSATIPAELAGADTVFDALADGLIFRESLNGEPPPPSPTRSLASRHAFLEGWAVLRSGDLFGADSAFSRAVAADPRYAEAHLWIALSRAWRRMKPPEWRASAEQAAGNRTLNPRNQVMADAVLAQGNGDYGRACPLWEGLVAAYSSDFDAWLGLATCREKDGLVVQDANSPSGWSFRTSYQSAIQAYRRAFELFPPVLASFRQGVFSELRQLFQTRASLRIGGHNEDPEGPGFRAAPAWRGDSLSVVPYPEASIGLAVLADPEEREEAVHRQRALLRDLALGWVSAHPMNPYANEALAVSLSMLGDSDALGRISRARELAAGEAEGRRLAGVEAWLRLAFAVPDDVEEIQRTRALADSVLAGETGGAASLDGLFLASLAALTGRGFEAAELMRSPGVAEELGTPLPLRETGPSLLVYAALGGPPDTLDALETRVRTDIEEDLLPEDRLGARARWLARPATLAFFEHAMASIGSLPSGLDFFMDYQASLAARDTLAVRRGLDELRALREGLLPGSVTMDSLLPETELLVMLEELDEAEAWLDPALRALPQNVPWIMTDPVRAATLVRAFALRARIAAELNDIETANAWRRTAQILWSDADPFLQTRMTELDRSFE